MLSLMESFDDQWPDKKIAINPITLMKMNGERYVFIYDDHSWITYVQTIERFADNPELTFNWSDACVLTELIRLSAKDILAAPDQAYERRLIEDKYNEFRSKSAEEN